MDEMVPAVRGRPKRIGSPPEARAHRGRGGAATRERLTARRALRCRGRVEIVWAAVEDWARVRAIRLAALADAPDAFSATLDEERARPPSFWQQRLGGDSAFTLLATRGDEDLGTAVLSAPAGSEEGAGRVGEGPPGASCTRSEKRGWLRG